MPGGRALEEAVEREGDNWELEWGSRNNTRRGKRRRILWKGFGGLGWGIRGGCWWGGDRGTREYLRGRTAGTV
jgi:hypothetical protein